MTARWNWLTIGGITAQQAFDNERRAKDELSRKLVESTQKMANLRQSFTDKLETFRLDAEGNENSLRSVPKMGR